MVLKDKSDKIYIKNSSIRENNLILKNKFGAGIYSENILDL